MQVEIWYDVNSIRVKDETQIKHCPVWPFRFLNSNGSTYENNVSPRDDIKVIKCGLKIPIDCDDYNDFKGKIKKSEEEFKERVFSINKI